MDKQYFSLFFKHPLPPPTPHEALGPGVPSCLLADGQVQSPPSGSQPLSLPLQPSSTYVDAAGQASQAPERYAGLPGPREPRSADPLVCSDAADWHPGPGVPAFYVPRSIQMRNSARGQVMAAWPYHVLPALLGPWQPQMTCQGGSALWSALPTAFLILSALVPCVFPTPHTRTQAKSTATFQPTPS